jgi:hypothetical protein
MIDVASLISVRRKLFRWLIGGAGASAALIERVGAQTPGASPSSNLPAGAVARPDFMEVFGRLDARSVLLIVGSVVILVLLILRVWIMVRGERRVKTRGKGKGKGKARGKAPTRPRSRVAKVAGDSLLRPASPEGAVTDWGPDQNKRASQSRASPGAAARLPDLDMAITQWSTSEVQNAAAISRQANDSMGKSPDRTPSPYQTTFNPYFRGETSNGARLEVVEVADALPQAELLVQLGDPKQAMTLLSNHIRDTEKPGPAVWLMLLNLYQSTGRKSQYEALAKGFKTLFNASVPPWSAKRETVRTIEAYPQVMAKVHAAWGKPAARPLLESYLGDDRGGRREGFSLTAYRDLLFLLEILGELDRMAVEEAERQEIQRKLGRIA